MTFRELAEKLIDEGIADLQSHGHICDLHGELSGAMVDAATIAVQNWLRGERERSAFLDEVFDKLIVEAGRVES